MRANFSDHKLYQTSLEVHSKSDEIDRDAISCASFNIEESSGLNSIPPTSHLRRHSLLTKRLSSIDLKGNGIIINGSLFDAQLFQTSRSSYIHDYRETPQELNRFLQGHHTQSKPTQLDPHLFKLSFILTLSEWHVDKELLLDYCPQENSKTHTVEQISHYKNFCFPELNSKATNGGTLINDLATYVFTRTNADGQVEYGYCRRITYENQITNFPTVICIVSNYSYFKLYDAILQELSTVYISKELECSLLMQSFYSKPLPKPILNTSGVVCKLNHHRIFYYICPTDERLNHDYFAILLSCLSPDHIVYLFESMLRSKKILCFSQSLSKLSKCCLALSFLLYPFIWPYPFVSLMPSPWLQDLLDSPCPYIYGCLAETRAQIGNTIERDSIFIDLDNDTIDIGLNDGFVLPLDLRQILHASLEYLVRFRLIKSDINLINIAISEACLHVFIEFFHRLPDFFQRHINDFEMDLTKIGKDIRLEYDFRSDEFLILQPTSAYVNFLNDFIHGMIFMKFLDDYQHIDHPFSLFTQRLNERRRMTREELGQNPVLRFRETFDELEKQMKHSSKFSMSIFSKLIKKFF